MKINLKLIGLIVIAAIIAFSFSACKTDNDLCDYCGNHPCSCCATCGLSPCGSWNITGTFNGASVDAAIIFTVSGNNRTWTSTNFSGNPSGTFSIDCNILTTEVTATTSACASSCICCYIIGTTIDFTIISNNQISLQNAGLFNKQ